MGGELDMNRWTSLRMPGLALDGPVTWKPNAAGIFGPDHLPVTFTPEA